jgi:hypothetical protein
VAPMHWATCLLIIFHENRHVSTYHSSMSTNENAPMNNQPICTTSSNCHIIMMVRPYHVAIWTIQTGTVSIPFFYLFGSANRSRYLLHTDSVCESKYTAGIRRTRQTQWYCFCHILSTLKIEQIFDPWSRF